jgi:hypothetical protein
MLLFCATSRARAIARELEIPSVQCDNLPARVLEGSAVIDDIVGCCAARGAIELRRHDGFGAHTAHGIATHHALELQLWWAVYDQNSVD